MIAWFYWKVDNICSYCFKQRREQKKALQIEGLFITGVTKML